MIPIKWKILVLKSMALGCSGMFRGYQLTNPHSLGNHVFFFPSDVKFSHFYACIDHVHFRGKHESTPPNIWRWCYRTHHLCPEDQNAQVPACYLLILLNTSYSISFLNQCANYNSSWFILILSVPIFYAFLAAIGRDGMLAIRTAATRAATRAATPAATLAATEALAAKALNLMRSRVVCEGNDGYGGFHKWGYPQIIHSSGIFHYKPSIFGYPHFRKPPYIWSLNVFWTGQSPFSIGRWGSWYENHFWRCAMFGSYVKSPNDDCMMGVCVCVQKVHTVYLKSLLF